ncbi:MAG: hypothetical protein V4557_06385 [Bacteroidota bacterium]
MYKINLHQTANRWHGYLLLLFVLIACNSTEKNSSVTKDTVVNNAVINDVVYKEVLNNLKEAAFDKADTLKKLLHFSSSSAYDTFLLIVPKGPIASSDAKFKVITHEGVEAYSETFPTRYFGRHVFEPDSIPQSANQESSDMYHKQYAISLPKEKIERFVYVRIREFFTEDCTIANKIDLRKMEEDNVGSAIDDELLSEAMTDPDLSFLCLIDFKADEGVYYLVYSKGKKKALRVYASD